MSTPVSVPLVADRIRKIRMLLNEISDDLAITDEQAKALSEEAIFFLDKLGDRLEPVNDPIDEAYLAACAYDREALLSPGVDPNTGEQRPQCSAEHENTPTKSKLWVVTLNTPEQGS